MSRCWTVLALWFCVIVSRCSRVEIKDNGYSKVLVALPRNLAEEDKPKVILEIEDMFRSSSEVLQSSTKVRAYFSEVYIIVPDNWNIPDTDSTWERTSFNSSALLEAGAALTTDDADLVIAEFGQHPYVLHQGGCGQRAKRILLPKDFLLGDEDKGVHLTRLWAEYRYGVFPEGGFKNDERYPLTYSMPGENDAKVTGCSDKKIGISNSCGVDGECSGNYTSSLMDQYLPSSANLFCEGYIGLGPHHNPEAPSKHNLVCNGESTWFTVMRSPDFARGRNAAPRHPQKSADVSFRFVRERAAPKVIVAVEVFSRMSRQKEFSLTKPSFTRFLYSTLPDKSEMTLILFGGDEGVKIQRYGSVLTDEESTLRFLESQLLPGDASEKENVSLEELFDVIFQTIGNKSDAKTSDIVIVTTASHLNSTTYKSIERNISDSECRLHVMFFGEDATGQSHETSLHELCRDTGGYFTSLHADAFGDMDRAFGKVVRSLNREILIVQEYLMEEDDVDLEISFDLDESLADGLKVYLSFPTADSDGLIYRSTTLQTPSGSYLNFLKMNTLNAWVIQLAKPEVGQYVLKTRRTAESTLPVLTTVTGSPRVSEDPITVDVWAETSTSTGIFPAPVRIYAEVRKGWHPVAGAQVTATIRHPRDRTTQQILRDDGLGDVDMTKDDGIYGSYFTRLDAPGYYNVYVKVAQGLNGTQVLLGPDDFCCGSFFPDARAEEVLFLQREVGPYTFHVPSFENSSGRDPYPPSRITDLRLTDQMDRICVLHWTAAGDDFDAGYAEKYELKVFRDTATIRNRFSGSRQELYSETIPATPKATYGTPLNHVFQLPVHMKRGLNYIAVRALDKAGNAGEPSNAIPVWVEESATDVVDCGTEDENCESGECEEMPRAESWRENAAGKLISSVVAFRVPINMVLPVMSLILSLVLINVL